MSDEALEGVLKMSDDELRALGGKSVDEVEAAVSKYGDEVNIADNTRKISAELYNKLRSKTPTAEIRKLVNKNYKKGMPDPALPGQTINTPLQADHIVSMDKITRMEGFGTLTEAEQLKILNYEKNFIGLSEAANKSKGAKSFLQWTEHKGLGIKVSEEFRNEMIILEGKIEKEVKHMISEFLLIKNNL